MGADGLDPGREGGHELAEEGGRVLGCQRAVLAEQIGGAADIGLGLLHHRHVQEHEGLAQGVVAAEAAQLVGRLADDAGGHAVEYALPRRPRADVDRVLQAGGHGAVVFRSDEQHRVGVAHLAAEPRPAGRRIILQVLVVERKVADLDDPAGQGRRRLCDQGVGELPAQRSCPEASDEDGDGSGFAHATLLDSRGRMSPFANCSGRVHVRRWVVKAGLLD